MKVLRALLFHNAGWKVVSLIIAFLFWFQIAGQQTVQRTISLPLEFINLAPQLEISNDYQKSVDVVIRSDRSGATFDEQQLAVVIDLQGATAGTQVIPLAEQNIHNRPNRIEILRIDPARIRLVLEKTSRRIVEVTPELVGKPARGYEVTRISADPKEVVIVGPQSRVEKVSTARTEPVDIEGLSGSVSVTAFLDLDDPRLRIENATSVEVEVVIEEKRRQIRIRGVRVRAPQRARTSLLTRHLDVIATVPLSFAGTISARAVEATVNIENLAPRRRPYELVPRVRVSEEYQSVFRLKTCVPERVKVRVR